MAFGVNPATGRPGPAPHPPRDGDKLQARQRINVEVRTPGERRHEYDHHHGYGAEHHYCVEPVCTKCHRARNDQRGESRQVRGERGRYVASGGGDNG